MPTAKEMEALISKTYNTKTGSKGNKFEKTGTGRMPKVPQKAESKMIMTY